MIDGLVPVVNVTTPLMSVPVTDIADGEVPAPVEVAILGVAEFPFKCFALTVALVFTVVTFVLPSCIVFDVVTLEDCPIAIAFVKASDTFAPYPMAIL